MVIDGLTTQQPESTAILDELKSYAQKNNMTIWVSCLEASADIEDVADTVLLLEDNSDGKVTLSVSKDGAGYAEKGAEMRLDPQSLTLVRS